MSGRGKGGKGLGNTNTPRPRKGYVWDPINCRFYSDKDYVWNEDEQTVDKVYGDDEIWATCDICEENWDALTICRACDCHVCLDCGYKSVSINSISSVCCKNCIQIVNGELHGIFETVDEVLTKEQQIAILNEMGVQPPPYVFQPCGFREVVDVETGKTIWEEI